MKKVLLAGTALVGLVALATPAHAELKLDLGGYFRGYGVYGDSDAPAGDASVRNWELRRDNEVQFTGETTLDNGLTVGAHTELRLGSSSPATDETYAYFSGGWGRVNFGSEDGAAYLLQVAAPSADSNIDGLRTYVQNYRSTFSNATGSTIATGGLAAANVAFTNGGVANPLAFSIFNANTGSLLDYEHADFRQTDRLTYLTPKFNGFQAGVSYAPQTGMYAPYGASAGPSTDTDNFQFDNLWEASARWDGEFQGFGISAGAGYSHASAENKAGTIASSATGAEAVGSDDLQTWNAGLNLTYSGWSLGGGYKVTNNGIEGRADTAGQSFTSTGTDTETTTWVVGGAWDNGPYHAGVSYFRDTFGEGVPGVAQEELEVERWTVGGGYTFGPGMTFRGAFAWGGADNGVAGVSGQDFKQGTIGTDIQF